MVAEVSPSPTSEQLASVCHDMLTIFPLLKVANSSIGGMVCTFEEVFFSKCLKIQTFYLNRTYTSIQIPAKASWQVNFTMQVEPTTIAL